MFWLHKLNWLLVHEKEGMVEEEDKTVSKPVTTVPDSVYTFVDSKALNILSEKSGHFPAVFSARHHEMNDHIAKVCFHFLLGVDLQW